MMTVGDVLNDKLATPQPKYWMGTVPATDDFGVPITNFFVDGKTKMGPWATMAPPSYAKHGVGTGTGKGQMYNKQPDGKWLKVKG
jgi:hypothetical protein